MKNMFKSIKIRILLVLVMISGLASPHLQAQDIIPEEAVARRLLQLLLESDVDGMTALLSEDLLQNFPIEQLGVFANGLEQQVGEFSHVSRVAYDQIQGMDAVVLVCHFEKQTLGMYVVLNEEMKVQTFVFNLPPAENFTPAPKYADTDAFIEREVYIPTGDIKLPAALTIPVEAESVPLVILVHGSGAHDMDATLGPNKIFRDLAWGLSSKGIAVLRYEKRNFRNAHTLDPESATAWDETGADALYAIKYGKTIVEVNPDKIYLLGHSLGGMMAPRIAAETANLAGIISMAGSPRNIWEIIPDQLEHIAKVSGGDTLSAQKQAERLRELSADLRKKRSDLNAEYTENCFDFFSASYLEDMNRHDIGEIAASLNKRILILHSERDYQVSMIDYRAWEDALKDHQKTSFILYPKLNHFFMEGEGVPNPAEYLQEANFAIEPVNDIIEWVLSE